MTLRMRLLLGAALVAAVMLLGSVAVSARQGTFVRDETDARLERLVPVAKAAVRRLDERDKAPTALVSAIADAWIGRFGDNGGLVTLISPADDPGLVPEFAREDITGGPTTRATSSGSTEQVRVTTTRMPNGDIVVIALSMDEGNRMLAGIRTISLLLVLVVVALLGLLVWWVDRLGIAPLARMTESARRIAGGETSHRVPSAPGNTEATALAEALNSMVDELKRSDERIRQFVADASHELRTPLTTVRGYSDLYESGALGTESDVSDAMRRIRSEADRMSRIVTDLLELRGVEEARIVAVPTSIDRLVQQCAADLRVSNPLRRISTTAEPCTATVDPEKITQAVMALGSNATDHTPADAGITFSVTRRPGTVRIEVADDGPGISAEHLDHVFERLYRVDRARSSGGNSGIGLSVVSAIVSAHNGTCGVNSAPGEGSVFWIELPVAPG
jgi:two-component system OmpR family sensor kinase